MKGCHKRGEKSCSFLPYVAMNFNGRRTDLDEISENFLTVRIIVKWNKLRKLWSLLHWRFSRTGWIGICLGWFSNVCSWGNTRWHLRSLQPKVCMSPCCILEMCSSDLASYKDKVNLSCLGLSVNFKCWIGLRGVVWVYFQFWQRVTAL